MPGPGQNPCGRLTQFSKTLPEVNLEQWGLDWNNEREENKTSRRYLSLSCVRKPGILARGSEVSLETPGLELLLHILKWKKIYTHRASIRRSALSTCITVETNESIFCAVFDMRSNSVGSFFNKYKKIYFDYVGLLCEHAGRRQLVGLKGLFYLIHFSSSSRYFYSSGHLLPLYLLWQYDL